MNLDFMYYLSTDHLGSINLIVDASNGNVVDDLSYDAWGRNRNPVNWTYSNITLSSVTDRGYTSHEQLPSFGLINMNGRVYDPMTMNFLSPDPVLQNPSNSQNYNRYSYCLNNPLKYTDPSGYNYSCYIDGLQMPFRTARQYMMSNWDNIDLNFHSTRVGSSSINTNITYKPNKIDGEAFKNSFRRLENLTGAAFTWKDSKLGRWSFYSFGYEDNLEEVSGENWPGVWLTKSAAAGASFNEISGLEYYNAQIEGLGNTLNGFSFYKDMLNVWRELGSGYGSENNFKGNNNSFIKQLFSPDISFGVGITTTMIGEATNIPNPPNWCKILGRRINKFGGAYGFLDNTRSAYDAFNKGHYIEAAFQTYQAYGYGAATIMLYVPITAPFAAPVLLWMTTLDIGEYYLKYYLNKEK